MFYIDKTQVLEAEHELLMGMVDGEICHKTGNGLDWSVFMEGAIRMAQAVIDKGANN